MPATATATPVVFPREIYLLLLLLLLVLSASVVLQFLHRTDRTLSLSMAAPAAVAASSPLQTKLYNLSFTNLTHQTLSLQSTNSSSIPFKPLKLNNSIQVPISLSLPFRHHFQPVFASLDNFEVAQDEITAENDDPETETQGYNEEQQQEQEQEEVKPTDSGEEGRLYVGNLPYSMNSTGLAELFEQAGRVETAEVIYDRMTDRSRGFGFVTMGSVEEAKEAIRMFNGSQVGGRTVRVNFPEVPKGGEREVMGPRIRSSYKGFVESQHKIYVGNLGWRVTSQALRDAFANQPGILSAKVIYERDTGRSRGFGFVSFESAENAEAALDVMNGVELEGRPLRLNLAVERAPRPPASEGTSEMNLESSELLSSIGT